MAVMASSKITRHTATHLVCLVSKAVQSSLPPTQPKSLYLTPLPLLFYLPLFLELDYCWLRPARPYSGDVKPYMKSNLMNSNSVSSQSLSSSRSHLLTGMQAMLSTDIDSAMDNGICSFLLFLVLLLFYF